MKNGKEIARSYMRLGLNPLPIAKGEKRPLIAKHNKDRVTESDIDNYPWDAIGVSTGFISGALEAIDFDLKNSNDPEGVMRTFKDRVPLELLKKLVVQRTQSGGYHMVYRCKEISSSKKLAKNSEGKAVIETRGEGGLIKCYPSNGYELIQGSFENIPLIQPYERAVLFGSAIMLSKTLIKDTYKRLSNDDKRYSERFPKYNDDLDLGIELLESAGWKVKSKDSEYINFTRPKSGSGDSHGGYNIENKFFFCFSTSQDTFEVEKPYSNSAIYAMTQCDGNFKVAYARLYEMGYGIEDDKKDKSDKKLAKEHWEESLNTLSFLSDDIEENTYLEQSRKGEVDQGLSTGWREIDEYFRFKANSLNIGLGYDGVGKSVFMLSMACASNILHDWKWGMVMPENRTAMSRRRLVETISGKPIDTFKNSPLLFESYLQQTRESFFIMSNKKHYSIRDVIKMGKRLYQEKNIDALLIDPYNFFKVEGNGYSHNNEILSELRVFAEQYCSVYIMAHPSSTSPRTNLDQFGYLKPPSKYSIQGGADFPYRVDDFFVTHRVVNHTDNEVKRTMQFIMEKVKETETGGKRHDLDDYSSLIWETRDSFLGYWDSFGDNPMYTALKSRQGIKSSVAGISPEEAF